MDYYIRIVFLTASILSWNACLLCSLLCAYVWVRWRRSAAVSKIITVSSKLLFSLLVTSVSGHASFPRSLSVPLPMAALQPQTTPPRRWNNLPPPTPAGVTWSPSLSLWIELNQTQLSECCIMWWWSLGGSLVYLIQLWAPSGALSEMFCNRRMRDNCQTSLRKCDSVYAAPRSVAQDISCDYRQQIRCFKLTFERVCLCFTSELFWNLNTSHFVWRYIDLVRRIWHILRCWQ